MSECKYFYEVTPEKILESVEALGLRCTGKIVALNSLENRVYDVEIEIEGEVDSRYDSSRVVKFYRPGRWSKEQLLEEHEFIADLAKQELPVVEPLKFVDGQTLGTLSDADGTELYYCVYPKVGGRIVDEFQDEQIALLGRLVARIHQVGRSKQARHRLKLSPETFALKNLEILKEGVLPPEVQERYCTLVEDICSVSQPWFEQVPLQRVHGDLHVGNLLWQYESCQIVDFDDFLMGPPIQDLWLIVAGREDWNLKQRELLFSSYSNLIDFDYDSIRLIEPLRALRLVHFSAWIAKRWEDPAFKNIFSDFGSPQYWREQLIALEEVRQIMYTGEVL